MTDVGQLHAAERLHAGESTGYPTAFAAADQLLRGVMRAHPIAFHGGGAAMNAAL
jgi:hypothetical protein